MSLKTIVKRLLSVFEANALHGMNKLVDSEKRLNQAALTVSDKIRELEVARLKNNKAAADMTKTAAANSADADKREQELKTAISRGVTPNKATVLVILHRRRIAEALLAKAQEIEGSKDKINDAIIAMGDKLDGIKANLELIRVQKETSDLGLTLPEDIDYSVGLTNIDIDAITREIEITDPTASAASPSSLEVDNYLASLTK